MALGENLNLTAVRKPAAAGILSFYGRIACGQKADGCGPAGRRILEKPTGFWLCTARRSSGPGYGFDAPFVFELEYTLSHNRQQTTRSTVEPKEFQTLLFLKKQKVRSHTVPLGKCRQRALAPRGEKTRQLFYFRVESLVWEKKE